MRPQKQKTLWKSDSNRKTVRADIVVEKSTDNETETFVLDTKWKMPRYDEKIVPSDADLHQMYVYLDVYGKAKKVALLYPGGKDLKDVMGKFVNSNAVDRHGEVVELHATVGIEAQCDMLFLPGTTPITGDNECMNWQKAIAEHIKKWLDPNKS